ncbi:hypothetical protein [Maribellus sediminis]|uniref:hypothetical protein n=1 Tax=Maribellus sediminis TaxID=2696285 RepID=UPI00143186D7|nr:hypothetical protein [Maribellus sediminis]
MRTFITAILMLLTLGTFAQQGLQLMLPEEDSVDLNTVQPAPSVLLNESVITNPDFLMYQLQPVPLSIEQGYMNRYTVNSSVLKMPEINYIPSMSLGMISPFYSNAQIFGGSSTKLNDKLTIGGFSYGANSIMTAPLPNRQNGNFDSYGSTMFMQYKVSKNFKIETRVSVGQQQGPPPPPGY